MNPLQSSIPVQHPTDSINSAQSLEASGSQAGPQHSQTLSLAGMSRNTLDALEQLNRAHEPLAMSAIGQIADAGLAFRSAQGADAHYATANGDLTVHARLNDQSLYDVISIGSPNANPIYLSVPPPPVTMYQGTTSVASQLASQYSRGQLTRALIMINSPQDFSDATLPSGNSVSTTSMVYSHDGSAGTSAGVPGPSRTRTAHAARSAPYPAPPLSSRSGPTSERLKRTVATDEQIDAHVHNADGSLRTQRDVGIALRDAGLAAANHRIGARLQVIREGRHPGATEEEIDAHLHDADGSLRTQKEVVSALRDAGLGAGTVRIGARRQAAGGGRNPGATDEQIDAHLHNADGSLRTQKEVGTALRDAGLAVDSNRIVTLRHAAGAARRQAGATNEQIDAHLHNADGSLRTYKEVGSALHAAGLGASKNRIGARLQAALGQR